MTQDIDKQESGLDFMSNYVKSFVGYKCYSAKLKVVRAIILEKD